MAALIDRTVTKEDDDSWTFQCAGVTGSPCGDPASGQPFHSSGWPSKKVAQARGTQHFAEHKGEGVTASLEDFRAEHGLVQHPNGTHAVRIEDLP